MIIVSDGSPMPKSKVVYFVNYPFRMAGANQGLFLLCQSRKESVAVIFMFSGPVADFFRSNGIEVYDLNYKPKWIGSFGKKIFKIKWYQVFTELIPEIAVLSYKLFQLTRSSAIFRNYRVVHFNDTRGLLTGGWFFKVFGFTIITHIRGEFDANNVKGIRWRLAKFLSHRFITVSNYLRDRMDEAGKAKAIRIYNGLEDLHATDVIPYFKVLQQQSVRIFLKVASVVPFKGIHVLIEAVQKLSSAARSRSLFIIAGPEPEEYSDYQQFLKQQITLYGLQDCFLFTGWQNDLSPFYDSCDVLVHTSMSSGFMKYNDRHLEIKGNEGLPRCILEAMRSSIPVIASKISGIPEQVESDYNGLLVEPNDPNQLANAIEELLNKPDEILQKYKRNARTMFLARFQLSQFVSSVERVYEELGKKSH